MRHLSSQIQRDGNRMVVTRGQEEGMRNYYLMGTGFWFYKMRKVLEVMVTMYLLMVNCTLKNG